MITCEMVSKEATTGHSSCLVIVSCGCFTKETNGRRDAQIWWYSKRSGPSPKLVPWSLVSLAIDIVVSTRNINKKRGREQRSYLVMSCMSQDSNDSTPPPSPSTVTNPRLHTTETIGADYKREKPRSHGVLQPSMIQSSPTLTATFRTFAILYVFHCSFFLATFLAGGLAV